MANCQVSKKQQNRKTRTMNAEIIPLRCPNSAAFTASNRAISSAFSSSHLLIFSINFVPLESSILSKQSSIVEANAKSQLSSKSRLQKVPLMSLTDEGIILIFDKSNVTLVLSSKVFRFTIPLIISKNPISSLMSKSFALKIVISCS